MYIYIYIYPYLVNLALFIFSTRRSVGPLRTHAPGWQTSAAHPLRLRRGAPARAPSHLVKREMEYRIHRLHFPVSSQRFPQMFGDSCKNETVFL